jgi:hypothetical protein
MGFYWFKLGQKKWAEIPDSIVAVLGYPKSQTKV